jgi:hypothetical protein
MALNVSIAKRFARLREDEPNISIVEFVRDKRTVTIRGTMSSIPRGFRPAPAQNVATRKQPI